MYIYDDNDTTCALNFRNIRISLEYVLCEPHQGKMECPFSSYLNTFNYSCMHN